MRDALLDASRTKTLLVCAESRHEPSLPQFLTVDREIIQIGSPDALVVSEAYAARAGISFRLSGFRFRIWYAKEREASGNQETIKPQGQGSGILVLSRIVRLLCEVSIFEQAMCSDRSVTLLPINLEIQTLLQCDSVAGYVNVYEFKSVLACVYDEAKLRVWRSATGSMVVKAIENWCSCPRTVGSTVNKALWGNFRMIAVLRCTLSTTVGERCTNVAPLAAAAGRDWREHRIVGRKDVYVSRSDKRWNELPEKRS
ncbi:hypothetical protein F5146DRAFT_995445 [Armillaria mellea]|nr:hypothetical protein F5146DRAFT_995445 [Armillaria mellea]